MYDEKDYFHKAPRFFQKNKTFVLNIDPPPAKQEDKNNSMILTIGPMITMSMTSMVTGYTALNSVLSGNSTMDKALPSLIICGAMFASVFIWPIFTKSYDKKMKKKQEKERQQKYSKYIEDTSKLESVNKTFTIDHIFDVLPVIQKFELNGQTDAQKVLFK